MIRYFPGIMRFLSIQAQDFIEDILAIIGWTAYCLFLSIQAQDFIEEPRTRCGTVLPPIPEHSSSGLH